MCEVVSCQRGLSIFAPLSPSIATMLTLMLSNLCRARLQKQRQAEEGAVTGVVGALINKALLINHIKVQRVS
jgi:hypothetical protein